MSEPEYEKEVEYVVRANLEAAIGYDYARRLTELVLPAVAEDINLCSDWPRFSSDDVRLALGRVLLKNAGEDV